MGAEGRRAQEGFGDVRGRHQGPDQYDPEGRPQSRPVLRVEVCEGDRHRHDRQMQRAVSIIDQRRIVFGVMPWSTRIWSSSRAAARLRRAGAVLAQSAEADLPENGDRAEVVPSHVQDDIRLTGFTRHAASIFSARFSRVPATLPTRSLPPSPARRSAIRRRFAAVVLSIHASVFSSVRARGRQRSARS